MEESDAPNLVTWRNRPEAALWLVQWEPLTVDLHLSWYRQARERSLLFMFDDRRTQKPVGGSNFYGFDRKGLTVEWLGLVSDGQPSGLMEGCYLAHRTLFELFGLQRAYAGTAEPNAAARRCAEFMGYKQEGLRRSHLVTPHGVYNVVEHGLLAPEFEERSAYLGKFFYGAKGAPEFTAEARQAASECRARWFSK